MSAGLVRPCPTRRGVYFCAVWFWMVFTVARQAPAEIAGKPSPSRGPTAACRQFAPEPAVLTEQNLEFRAGRVELDLARERLELTRDVVVRVGRYRLTSDRLCLVRHARALVVEGPGRIALCPCADAPVSFGFQSAVLAPPTDLLVAEPTLRLGGVEVLWVPYLWLRSPDRVGLLPATVAYRGQDGWFAGSGLHLPWGQQDPEGHIDALDLRAGAYLQGGTELSAELATAHSTTALRWDHMRRDLVAVDAEGSVTSDALGATTAWSVDALRGPRALSGPVTLEQAARRFDRARWAVLRPRATSTLGLALQADVARGSRVDRLGAAGPRIGVGSYYPLGGARTFDLILDARSIDQGSAGVTSLAQASGQVLLVARPAGMATRVELADRITLGATELDQSVASETYGGAELGVTLVRAFGPVFDQWLHVIEPSLRIHAGHAVRSGPLVGDIGLAEGPGLALLACLRTAIGRLGSRSAVEAETSTGWSGTPDTLVPIATLGVGSSGEVLASKSLVRWILEGRGIFATSTRARFGGAKTPALSIYIEGRSAAEPRAVRWLTPEVSWPITTGWFDRDGWTAGSELRVPWSRVLTSSLSVDRDLTRQRWLAWVGTLGYRHACGCLGLVGGASQRLGRRGLEGWLSIELVP